MSTLLEVHDLSTHFHTQDGVVKAVEHASYEVDRGEVIALVGESGCGKTVSALSIVRLIQEPPGKIVSGQVNFNGIDLLQLSRQAVRKVRGSQIAMIFNGYQNIFGAPYLVVFPAIAVGILMLAFTFLGDGLRDALDPRERR